MVCEIVTVAALHTHKPGAQLRRVCFAALLRQARKERAVVVDMRGRRVRVILPVELREVLGRMERDD